jgi:hypothetical protein
MTEPVLKTPEDKFAASLLADGELLLRYAAGEGLDIEDPVRDGVLQARLAAGNGVVPESAIPSLLTAVTKLAAKVKPVTVESLKITKQFSFHGQIYWKIVKFEWVCVGIGLFIAVFSAATFVSSDLSSKIRLDVDTANGLVTKLRAELGPWPPVTNSTNGPAGGAAGAGTRPSNTEWFGAAGLPPGLSCVEVITDLQQFAATMRQIHGYSGRLKHCLLDFSTTNEFDDPTNRLELTPGLPFPLAQELTSKAGQYERVRGEANKTQELVTVYYGAIACCFLPILYALLGAGAFVLRLYDNQIKSRTFVHFQVPSTRLLVAGISGLVVGLFNNVSEGVSFSPFAIAFLAGYGTDVFFASLEGFLQVFQRGPGNTASAGPTNSGSPSAKA